MTTTSNDAYISEQGTEYYNGLGVFTGIDGGTSTNVLTSTGMGSIPSFQAMPSSMFAPNATIEMFDDFISTDPGPVNGLSAYTWQATTVLGVFTIDRLNITSSNPGMLSNQSVPPSSPVVALALGSNVPTMGQGPFILGGGEISVNFVFKIVTIQTLACTITMGLGDLNQSIIHDQGDLINGCYVSAITSVGSGNWFGRTSSSNTVTSTVASSFGVTTGFHNVQILINANASSVSYYVDGVSIGSTTTNIPTTPITPIFQIAKNGTANVVSLDLFYLKQTLTTPR